MMSCAPGDRVTDGDRHGLVAYVCIADLFAEGEPQDDTRPRW